MVEKATSGEVRRQSYEKLAMRSGSQFSHHIRHALDEFVKRPTNRPEDASVGEATRRHHRLEDHVDQVKPLIIQLEQTLEEDQGVNAFERNRIIRLAFGLYARPELIFSEPQTRDEKVFLASLSHDLALAVLTRQSGHSSKWYQDMVYAILDSHGSITSAIGNSNMAKFWAGVKSEVGLIRALSRMGLEVYIPDPTDPYAVEALSVSNHIAMIAVNPEDGTILTIDAKGGKEQPTGPYYEGVTRGQVDATTNPIVADVLRQITQETQDPKREISGNINDRTVVHTKIELLKGNREYWKPVAYGQRRGRKNIDSAKYLQDWSKLNEQYEDALTASINELLNPKKRHTFTHASLSFSN